MNYKLATVFLLILFTSVYTSAQLSTNEKPPSFELKAELFNYDAKLVQEMPKIELKKIRRRR